MSDVNESAVSPIIAVILIIMLTVVITGIFAVVALGFGNLNLSGKVVGVTAQPYSTENDHGVIAQFWGGKDMNSLKSVRAYIGDLELVLKGTTDSEITNPQVGTIYYFSTQSGYRTVETVDGTLIELTEVIDIDTEKPQYVNFVGTFADGTEQVIYMWQLPIPEITADPGVYFENEYVRVTGYANNVGWLGHGLLIQTLKPKVTLGSITQTISAYSLTPVGGSTPYTSGLLSGGIQKETDATGKIYYTLPFISGNSFMPYNTPVSEASEMTGTVSIAYKVEGHWMHFENIAVHIPPRINVNTSSTAYSGTIVKYAKDQMYNNKVTDALYLRLNDINKASSSGTPTFHIAMYLVDGETQTLLYNSENLAYFQDYFLETGHGLWENFNLEVVNPNAVLEVYIVGPQTRDGKTYNTVWYLVDRKHVSTIPGVF